MCYRGNGRAGGDGAVAPLVSAEASREMEEALDLLNLQTTILERIEVRDRLCC